jgi:glycosyltransferase involved in cell wall biosynthesis
MNLSLSVIIPAYNVAEYITDSICSALAQTFSDLEVIVVDDGSTDATYEMAASVKSDRLRIIRQTNAGPAVARNTGIRAAQGEYIGFLDADDLWYPDKAQRHLEVMQRLQDVDLTFAWWRVIDENGRDTGRTGKPRQERIGFDELLLQNTTGNGSTVVARKAAIEQAGFFDTGFTGIADHHLWLQISRIRERNIYCIREVLSDYRMRTNQLTKDWQAMLNDWEKLMAAMALQESARVAGIEVRARARFARYLAYLAYEAGDHTMARRFLLQALRAEPALMGDRGSWITIAAVSCTVLPTKIHRWLAASVKDLRMQSR